MIRIYHKPTGRQWIFINNIHSEPLRNEKPHKCNDIQHKIDVTTENYNLNKHELQLQIPNTFSIVHFDTHKSSTEHCWNSRIKCILNIRFAYLLFDLYKRILNEFLLTWNLSKCMKWWCEKCIEPINSFSFKKNFNYL